jgi:hypothetical protein
MSYVEQWRALSARIRAFVEIAGLYASFQQSNAADGYGGAKYLGDQSQRILAAITEFARSNEATLPPEVLLTLR